MRKMVLLMFLFLIPMMSHSHTWHFSWGSYNGRYFYPQTRLQYFSPPFKIAPMNLEISLDMMGTFGFKFSDSFDLGIQAWYQLKNWDRLALLGGGGLVWNSNQLTGTNSVQTLLSVMLSKVWYPRHSLYLPVTLRFYGNGWDTQTALEYLFSIHKRVNLSARLEYHLLSFYDLSAFESRVQMFLGLGFTL